MPDLVEFVRIGRLTERNGFSFGSQMWVGKAEDEEDLVAKLSET